MVEAEQFAHIPKAGRLFSKKKGADNYLLPEMWDNPNSLLL